VPLNTYLAVLVLGVIAGCILANLLRRSHTASWMREWQRWGTDGANRSAPDC
jgi:hypothetical protein